MNIVIIALTVMLAHWIASLAATMPAYTCQTFYRGVAVVAAIVIFMQLPT